MRLLDSFFFFLKAVFCLALFAPSGFAFPALEFSTQLGGSGSDAASAVAVDKDGNVYVTGTTTSTDFPLVNPQSTSASGLTIFVTKINPATSKIIYSTYIGGGNVLGIAVDSSGSAYITGSTINEGYPGTSGTLKPSPNFGFPKSSEAFVTKLSPDGSKLVYSTFLGGTKSDLGNAIAVDADGNAYVVGQTFSTDFPIVNGFQQNFAGRSDAFVAKLNATGSALLYSTYLGGALDEEGTALALAPNGDLLVVGGTVSTDFPRVNAFQNTFAGNLPGSLGLDGDAFVTRIKLDGSAPVFSTYLGGSSSDEAFGVAVDAAGHVFVAGRTLSLNFPMVSAAQSASGDVGSTSPKKGDAFVTEIAADGSGLLYSTFLGGFSADQANGISVDGDGNATIIGTTLSGDFPYHYDGSTGAPPAGAQLDFAFGNGPVNGAGLFAVQFNTPTTPGMALAPIQLSSNDPRAVGMKLTDIASDFTSVDTDEDRFVGTGQFSDGSGALFVGQLRMVAENDGTSFFLSPNFKETGGFIPVSAAVGDVNDSDDLTVGVLGESGGAGQVIIGQTDPAFPFSLQFRQFVAASLSSDILSGDFDGDGVGDIVTVSEEGDTKVHLEMASLLGGLSDGTFGLPAGAQAFTTAAVLHNGNGDKDRLCVVFAGPPQPGSSPPIGKSVAEFFDFSGGVFVPGETAQLLPNTSAIAFGRLNDDAILDIMVATQSDIEMFPGQSDGTFGSPTTLSSGSTSGPNPISVMVTDINGDGTSDVVALNRGSGTVSTFLAIFSSPDSKGKVDAKAAGTVTFKKSTLSLPGDTSRAQMALTHVNGDAHPTAVLINVFAGDSFVAKIGADGTLKSSVLLGGTGVESGKAIAQDASGKVFVAGQTASSDFHVYRNVPPLTGGTVYLSVNPTNSWSLRNFGLPSAPVLTMASGVNGEIFAGLGSGGGVYDYDFSWSSIGLGGKDVNAIAVAAGSRNQIYAGTAEGVYVTSNHGGTWTLATSTPKMSEVYSLATDPLAPAIVYAGSAGGVFISMDSGQHWSKLAGAPVGNVRALAVDPVVSGTVYAGTADNGVFKSSNGGVGPWDLSSTGLGNLKITAIAIDRAAPATVYAGTEDGGIWKSIDRAATWTAVNTGLSDLRVQAIAVDPQNSANVYVGTAGGFFASANGGTNWMAANGSGSTILDNNVRAIAVDQFSEIFAGTQKAPLAIGIQGDAFVSEIVELAPPPSLRVTIDSPGMVKITWPATTAIFILESIGDFSSSQWQTVDPQPPVQNGLNVVTLPAAGFERLFRLRGQ